MKGEYCRQRNLLLHYIEIEHSNPHEKQMLLQAYAMRALVILFNGLDEAAGLKSYIEELIVNDLEPNGFRVVATSRPEGVDLARYTEQFVIMNLKELDSEQRNTLVTKQLGESPLYTHLSEFAHICSQHTVIIHPW